MDDFKRNHIPTFGNWDYEDGLPITQYFESARQAGLLRYSYGEAGAGAGDLYSYSTAYEENDMYLKPTIAVVPRSRKQQMKTKGTQEKGYQAHVKEQKRQGRVYDVEQTVRQQQHHQQVLPSKPTRTTCVGRAPKAVDEDLYKIPPELLNTYPKKKKIFGFFSRCLVPSCAT